MKKASIAIALFALYASVFALTSCAALKKGAKGAIDVADWLCIVAHADIDDDAAMLACSIIQDYKDDAKKLLAETRKTSAKMAAKKASACGPSDAGTIADAGKGDAK